MAGEERHLGRPGSLSDGAHGEASARILPASPTAGSGKLPVDVWTGAGSGPRLGAALTHGRRRIEGE
jgi:hypothetical protein